MLVWYPRLMSLGENTDGDTRREPGVRRKIQTCVALTRDFPVREKLCRALPTKVETNVLFLPWCSPFCEICCFVDVVPNVAPSRPAAKWNFGQKTQQDARDPRHERQRGSPLRSLLP